MVSSKHEQTFNMQKTSVPIDFVYSSKEKVNTGKNCQLELGNRRSIHLSYGSTNNVYDSLGPTA